MASSKIRWAIVGTGGIARRFAGDMRFSRLGRVVAAASRSPDRAQAFAAAIGPDVAHGSTEAVLARPDVDAVYVATTNAAHVETALAALAAGKPVLIEKPVASRAEDAAKLAEAARQAGLLAMEAMWMRFTPGIVKLKALLDSGAIGRVHSLRVELGFAPSYRREAALFDPVHGGALLDLGVYPLSLAQLILGEAEEVKALTRSFDNGAIADAALVARYGDAVASLSCSLTAEGRNEAHIVGTHGVLTLHRPFFCPPMLSLRPTHPGGSGPQSEAEVPAPIGRRPAFAGLHALRQMVSGVRNRRFPILFEGTGLQYQADHFAECLQEGLTESPVMPLSQSVAVLKTIDAISREARSTDTRTGS